MAKYTQVPTVHEFRFPVSCSLLALSGDGTHIVGAGLYRPVVGIYELAQQTLKCERHTDAETRALVPLGDDWMKLALLQKDRTVEFHSRFGKHYVLPLPAQAHAAAADGVCAELLLGADGRVLRFNLDEGKFYAPLAVPGGARVEALALARAHGLCGAFCADGEVAFFDARDKAPVRTARADGAACTAGAFHADGLLFAAGTGDGRVLVHDLRSAAPLLAKDHLYGFPIKQLAFHQREVVSLDKKCLRVWDRASGRARCTVERDWELNAFALSESILFLGGEHAEVESFYVPALGIVPRWCAHLEGVAEQLLDERRELFFNTFRFVTRAQVDALGLAGEIGKQVAVYMHGYLVDQALYRRVQEERAQGAGCAPEPAQGPRGGDGAAQPG